MFSLPSMPNALVMRRSTLEFDDTGGSRTNVAINIRMFITVWRLLSGLQ